MDPLSIFVAPTLLWGFVELCGVCVGSEVVGGGNVGLHAGGGSVGSWLGGQFRQIVFWLRFDSSLLIGYSPGTGALCKTQNSASQLDRPFSPCPCPAE